MNRLHKYRAWDKHTKVMTYSVNVYSEAKDEDCWWCADVLNDRGDTSYCFEKDTGVLMEFTGVHDNNRKKIYEGDIITSALYQFKDGYVHDVYFNNGDFRVRWTMFRLSEILEHMNNKLEVIGNIYEDENLLNP